MRDRDRLRVDRLTLLTTQIIWFDLYSSWGDLYYYTPPSMKGSLRLRAMIARHASGAGAQLIFLKRPPGTAPRWRRPCDLAQHTGRPLAAQRSVNMALSCRRRICSRRAGGVENVLYCTKNCVSRPVPRGRTLGAPGPASPRVLRAWRPLRIIKSPASGRPAAESSAGQGGGRPLVGAVSRARQTSAIVPASHQG
jgi:hypothetical protein